MTTTSHARRPKTATPDHFYTVDGVVQVEQGAHPKPDDDPAASRGTPVFRPSMAEFSDFERYMNAVEPWGVKSGIVKIIPPAEWTAALPSVTAQLDGVRIKNPIEQDVVGTAGLFRVQNIEKRRLMSVREWFELCSKDEMRTPGILDGDRRARQAAPRSSRKRAKTAAAAAPTPTPAPDDAEHDDAMDVDPALQTLDTNPLEDSPSKPHAGKRSYKERMDARNERDAAFLADFEPHIAWLPPGTTADDYTPEFCRTLERMYWRSLGLGRAAWYGADSEGSLFTDATAHWNVAHLPSLLTRLLPRDNNSLPGVNTPYLYFGMWRATFAWHVEDMDLFSINYIHFGAPKHWYAIPQARATAFEKVMKANFPSDISQCPQFLRHKAFLVSPSQLASTCKPNTLVQHAGEFVITYPRGYHAGFNLGFNCAESVNFALDSWLELGRKALYCTCISDSVRINVDELLLQRAEELEKPPPPQPTRTSPLRKRKAPEEEMGSGEHKKIRFTPVNKLPQVLTELNPSPPKPPRPPRVQEESTPDMPCCLCASADTSDLLPVHDPPMPGSGPGALPGVGEDGKPCWRAHASCARVVPETWIDEVEGEEPTKWVFGVDAIVKDRWNLKCQLCASAPKRMHGAPIQCAKGKCPRAFHVSCARGAASEQGLSYTVTGEVEKEVVLVDPLREDRTVVTTIRKDTVELFCAQHNPSVKADKKKSRDEKIRNELLALPAMSRVRVRVSSGVYEVSVVRVIEEDQAIEVLWSDGVKKMFKWGSIVWGATAPGEGVMNANPTDSNAGASTSTASEPKLITPSAKALADAAAPPQPKPPAPPKPPKPPKVKATKSASASKSPLPYPYYPPPPPGYYYAPYPYPLPPPPTGADGKSAPMPPFPFPAFPPGAKPPPPGASAYHALAPPPPSQTQPPSGTGGKPGPYAAYPYPPPAPNMRYYPSAIYQSPNHMPYGAGYASHPPQQVKEESKEASAPPDAETENANSTPAVTVDPAALVLTPT
ncbi:JmjC-domain-containing protein [Exidia glandulosa HHB12029]|uniref:[histone H3]-trimethyl-L-lysine(9) demethylase n=1 Tax=Exidia glandulosa HHB12029 TaxID=1314781 RepID=A0A165CKP5_EXIGL|nr:JmjC-domain-containing protein [Exidia glandulosa HHB12029]